MDILDNVATELGFEFHLYIVQDQLFGGKQKSFKDFSRANRENDDFLSKNSIDNDFRSSNAASKNKKPGRKKGC